MIKKIETFSGIAPCYMRLLVAFSAIIVIFRNYVLCKVSWFWQKSFKAFLLQHFYKNALLVSILFFLSQGSFPQIAFSFSTSYRQSCTENRAISKIADAIYKAEGSKSSHPYGILNPRLGCNPARISRCREICIRTIKHRYALWSESKYTPHIVGESVCNRLLGGKEGVLNGFIPFLAKSYAPIGATNDPDHLNVNWVKNVSYFYEKSLLHD